MIAALTMLCLLLSFLLSGVESAVLSVSRVRVRHAADEGDGRARTLLPLIEDRDALLGAVTVMNHVANLSGFLMITWNLVLVLGTWGYVAGFLIALPVFLIGLETVPKTLFRRYPFRLLRALLPLVRLAGLFRMPFRAIRQMQRGGDEAEGGSSVREDLKALAASLATQRLLPPAAAALIARVIDFRRHKTGALMTPLPRVTAVAPDTPVRDAMRSAAAGGLTALPVCEAGGKFVGMIDMLELPAAPAADRLVRQYLRPADEVATTAPALHTLQRLRRRARSLALVRETVSGRLVGLITEEDLLRPLLQK
jgi:CBS domain containing-hemolysin-like protein